MADDGGVYYIRHLALGSFEEVWWAGLSTEMRDPQGVTTFQIGLDFTNVFRGRLRPSTAQDFIPLLGMPSAIIQGEWSDVPRGTILNHGNLTLAVFPAWYGDGKDHLFRISYTGGFAGRTWTKAETNTALWPTQLCFEVFPLPPSTRPCSFHGPFDHTRRNDGNTMRDHMEEFKAYVAVYGNVIGIPHVGFPGQGAYTDRTPDGWFGRGFAITPSYRNFICADKEATRGWNNGRSTDDLEAGDEDPPDGDMNLDFAVDRAQLDAQTNLDGSPFWTQNSEWQGGGADVFKATLDQYHNGQLHPEIIMYGRNLNRDDSRDTCGNADYGFDSSNPSTSYLPGWAGTGGNSVLWNGRPIDGSDSSGDWGKTCSPLIPTFCPYNTVIGFAHYCDGHKSSDIEYNLKEDIREMTGGADCLVTEIRGQSVQPIVDSRKRVRLTGALATDCHGFDCEYDEGNPEIHPVYSIDIIDPSSRPNLTGVWAGSDSSTYYVRHIRHVPGSNTPDKIWWLGLSRDRGETYASVFQGTIQGNIVGGNWADIPIGKRGSFSTGVVNQLYYTVNDTPITDSAGRTHDAWTFLANIYPDGNTPANLERLYDYDRVTKVSIDIKPSDEPNRINLRSNGVVPVAILTTASFDASTVDPSTVKFGRTGTEASPVHSALEDVNMDGNLDLVLQFKVQETGFIAGDSVGILTGITFDGIPFNGTDSVSTR